MINLSNTTLVCVSSVEINNSIQSLVDSMKVARFYDVKFITDVDVVVPNIKTEKCKKINSFKEYSNLLMYDLHKYVESDFCLIVQHDSKITHPELWSDEFLLYDYIGAPWPLPGTEWKPDEDIVNSDGVLLDKYDHKYRIGNGGFSLRSKRLLTTPTRIHIPTETPSSQQYINNEDWLICIYYRHLYESDGNIFAPFEVANVFSKEMGNHNTFGQHRGSV